MTHVDSRPARPCRSRFHGRLGQVLSSLQKVIAYPIRRSADGRRLVGQATRASRYKVLTQAVRDLHELGFLLKDVRNLAQRHLRALFALWERRGYSANSREKRCSVLRLLCRWLDKPTLLDDTWAQFALSTCAEPDAEPVAETPIRRPDVDVDALLACITACDPRVALHLRLIQVFGLTVREAMLLRPLQADHGTRLCLSDGTRSGRPRWVSIATPAQRALLEEAKTWTGHPLAPLLPQDRKLDSWLNHYYYVLRRCGWTRQQGVTGRPLRR